MSENYQTQPLDYTSLMVIGNRATMIDVIGNDPILKSAKGEIGYKNTYIKTLNL